MSLGAFPFPRARRRASGFGLVEHATDSAAPANPDNISTRGFVEPWDGVMIGGFIIGGGNLRHLAIRAIGSSLAAAGVTNPLLDPVIELHDQNGVLMETNDNWKENQTEVEATGLQPNDVRESVIVTTLSPGSYTAIIRGAAVSPESPSSKSTTSRKPFSICPRRRDRPSHGNRRARIWLPLRRVL